MNLKRNIFYRKAAAINPQRIIMKKLLKNTARKIGQSPGSLIYTGEKQAGIFKCNLISYEKDQVEEKIFSEPEEILQFLGSRQNIWINIDGIQQADRIGKIGGIFKINPLTLEDILNTAHRPKTEDLGEYIFIVIKLLKYDDESQLKVEHVSLVLGKNFALSFQEDEKDEFEVIRESIRKNKGHIRDFKTDYLTYRLLDWVIDNYFSVLEYVGDRIEEIEDELLAKPSSITLHRLYRLKADLILIRRAAWPLREAINNLEKTESELIKNSTSIYLRDLYDHIIQIIDTTENYREMIAGMMDIYLSSVSNRLNEVMKVLTIISTVFIPLTFIAGIYGMNFNTSVSSFNMPELNWFLGYPIILSVMLLIAISLLYLFKRKKWF